MKDPTTKTELLAALREARREWNPWIAKVSLAHLKRAGCAWRVVDKGHPGVTPANTTAGWGWGWHSGCKNRPTCGWPTSLGTSSTPPCTNRSSTVLPPRCWPNRSSCSPKSSRRSPRIVKLTCSGRTVSPACRTKWSLRAAQERIVRALLRPPAHHKRVGNAPNIALEFRSASVTKLRHSLSLLLPFLMVVILPYWLLDHLFSRRHPLAGGRAHPLDRRFRRSVVDCRRVGAICLVHPPVRAIGQGTLAPWDPTRNLVAGGPYQYVRNPMISSVAVMLAGQALFWGSAFMGIYLGVFCWSTTCISYSRKSRGWRDALAKPTGTIRRVCCVGCLEELTTK